MQRGQAAARVGHRDEARQYLRQAVQLEPDRLEAWLDLAGVEDDPADKRACFQSVLDIDPSNVEARLGLEMLEGIAGPAALEHGLHHGHDEDGRDEDLEAVIAQASRQLEDAVGPPPAGEVALDDQVLYCANHPSVETVLRCNRCGKPICTRCAVQTPVGYRCKQCVGQQQAAYFTGGPLDYIIAGVVSAVLGGTASYIAALLGMWFIALILGPVVGVGIAEAVRLAVRRRRTRYLWLVTSAGMVVGTLPALMLALSSGSLWRLLSLGIFLVLAVGAASARLR
jgi:hypothetical protein